MCCACATPALAQIRAAATAAVNRECIENPRCFNRIRIDSQGPGSPVPPSERPQFASSGNPNMPPRRALFRRCCGDIASALETDEMFVERGAPVGEMDRAARQEKNGGRYR